jgi:isopentenyl diphosphate isomerase/L-lactate dehydrogenase-like FMN-dependent dehydrogenase
MGKAEVLLDGGIRRGTDIVKALAFGAKAVSLAGLCYGD